MKNGESILNIIKYLLCIFLLYKYVDSSLYIQIKKHTFLFLVLYACYKIGNDLLCYKNLYIIYNRKQVLGNHAFDYTLKSLKGQESSEKVYIAKIYDFLSYKLLILLFDFAGYFQKN